MDLLQASVDEVVNFLSQSFAKIISNLMTLFPLEQITLTMKTVMLCALSSAQGEQTCALDLMLRLLKFCHSRTFENLKIE